VTSPLPRLPVVAGLVGWGLLPATVESSLDESEAVLELSVVVEFDVVAVDAAVLAVASDLPAYEAAARYPSPTTAIADPVAAP
jgi:hypothetical protein